MITTCNLRWAGAHKHSSTASTLPPPGSPDVNKEWGLKGESAAGSTSPLQTEPSCVGSLFDSPTCWQLTFTHQPWRVLMRHCGWWSVGPERGCSYQPLVQRDYRAHAATRQRHFPWNGNHQIRCALLLRRQTLVSPLFWDACSQRRMRAGFKWTEEGGAMMVWCFVGR